MELKTAYDMLSETPLFRKSVKMYAKQAMRRIEDYDTRVLNMMRNNLTGDREQYWLDHSVVIYDGFFREIGKSQNISLEPEFRKGRLSYIQEPWQKVVDSICKSRNPVNMENEQIKTAFQTIEKRMVGDDLINASGKTALSLNPNVIHEPNNK